VFRLQGDGKSDPDGPPTFAQAPVYEIKILALTAQNRWAEASRAALEILKNLGLNLPTAPGKWQIRLSRLKTKILLAGKSCDDLAHLPSMTDPPKTAIMRVIMRANADLSTIYPALYPVLANEQLRLTVRHGNGPASSTAYLNYRMLLASEGNMEAGYQFVQLALRFLEQPQAEVSRIPTRFAFNLTFRPLDSQCCELEITSNSSKMSDFKCFLTIIADNNTR